MKKILKLLLIFMCVFQLCNTVWASEVPAQVTAKLKENFGNINVRFDGLVTLPDGTEYIPLYPSEYKESQTPYKVKVTIPASKTIKQKPDLIVFENNFSLIKIIREEGERPTLIRDDKIPLEVKLSLLPQDLMVPKGLAIPPELRIILGDLKIPVIERPKFSSISDKGEKKVNLVKNKSANADSYYKVLANQRFYITNFSSNSVYMVKPEVGRPQETLKMSSIPSAMEITGDERYLFISELASNKLTIVDTLDNRIVKELTVGDTPKSIVTMDNINKAFIACKKSSEIYVLNLKTMELIQKLKVEGNPDVLAASEDEKFLYYSDNVTGKIFCIDINKEMETTLITTVSNISKILPVDKTLLILNRLEGKLIVFDLENKKISKEIPVGEKPVDIKNIGYKIYVLNAGSDTLSVFNYPNYEKITDIELKSGGFPTNIVVLSSLKKALITNISAYEILLIDLEKEALTQRIPISLNITSIIVAHNLNKE